MCIFGPRVAPRYAQTYPARSGIESVQLSQHFQLASDRDRVVYMGVSRSATCDPAYRYYMPRPEYSRSMILLVSCYGGSGGSIMRLSIVRPTNPCTGMGGAWVGF